MRIAVAAFLALVEPAIADLSEHSFPSQTLGREMAFSVYVPPGYNNGHAVYPVLYLLHGLGDDHRTWARAGIEAIADDAGADGGAPLIVVMPDAGVSWYADADEPAGPGNLHAAIRDDLVAHVDATWRTRPERAARAVAGHSMGAQGALSIAFDAPERFGAAASMSLSPGPRMIERIEGGETLSDDRARGWLGGAYGVPFRPDLYHADLPETRAGTLGPETAPRIYLHASDDDPFDTHIRSVALYSTLRARNIEPELRITDGGHSWDVWKAELPRILAFLSAGNGWSE